MEITIRAATEKDCFDIWQWRNHPEVRKVSFNIDEISYEEHLKWFSEKLRDNNVKIYIAENENSEKIGQARFDINKEGKAYISVNLNPDFFRKGFGNKIIKKATEVFFRERPDIKEVIAEVIEENIASKKAFEKANYQITEGGREEEPKNNNIGLQKERRLNVCFMGGKQAGIIGMLTILSRGYKIIAAVSYSEDLSNILSIYKIPTHPTINDKKFIKALTGSDILICVHGREIVPKDLISLPRLGAINVHPYLYRYKGANPIGRALEDKNFKASVGVHRMSEEVDQGEVLVEEFVDVSGAKSIEEIYNKLYPYYAIAIIKALDIIVKDEHRG